MIYYCSCGILTKSRSAWEEHYYQQSPKTRIDHQLRKVLRMKRNDQIVSILEKIGYKIGQEEEDVDYSASFDHSQIVARIERMWIDNQLYEHTKLRVDTMSEKALLARVGKIKDKEKMLCFAKVLIEKKLYPAVLDAVITEVINNGW